MSRIFISYKRVDKEKVFKIKEQIESALGEKCWIDLDGIESDAQFASVIINAIDESEIVLFMYSQAHEQIVDFDNDWTIRELSYAKEEHKRIVFVNIDNSPLIKWFRFMFPQKQIVDINSHEEFDRLIGDISNWLEYSSHLTGISSKDTMDYTIDDCSFLMYVDDVCGIEGRGTVATGLIERGEITVGDELQLLTIGVKSKMLVMGIEKDGKLYSTARAGDEVGLLLKGVDESMIKIGMILCVCNNGI